MSSNSHSHTALWIYEGQTLRHAQFVEPGLTLWVHKKEAPLPTSEGVWKRQRLAWRLSRRQRMRDSTVLAAFGPKDLIGLGGFAPDPHNPWLRSFGNITVRIASVPKANLSSESKKTNALTALLFGAFLFCGAVLMGLKFKQPSHSEHRVEEAVYLEDAPPTPDPENLPKDKASSLHEKKEQASVQIASKAPPPEPLASFHLDGLVSALTQAQLTPTLAAPGAHTPERTPSLEQPPVPQGLTAPQAHLPQVAALKRAQVNSIAPSHLPQISAYTLDSAGLTQNAPNRRFKLRSISQGLRLPEAIAQEWEHVLEGQVGFFRKCWEQNGVKTGAYANLANLNLDLQFTVDSEGSVKSPRVLFADHASTVLQNCLIDVISQLHFPEPPAPRDWRLEYPIEFRLTD